MSNKITKENEYEIHYNNEMEITKLIVYDRLLCKWVNVDYLPEEVASKIYEWAQKLVEREGCDRGGNVRLMASVARV